MMRFRFGIIIGFLLATITVSAGIIGSPPPSDIPPQTQQYLFDIWQNLNRPPIQTTTPNGNRNGKRGELVTFNDSGTFKLFQNTDGGTTWQQL